MPVDASTGERAVRLHADCTGFDCADDRRFGFAPQYNGVFASRLRNQIVNAIHRQHRQLRESETSDDAGVQD